MKTTVSAMVLFGFLALPGWGPPRAAEPRPSVPTGRVLVLENQHTLEGDIERVGDRYRVRRSVGETWVPADRVIGLVASEADAYAFLRSRANLEDADERLRLANWCRLHGLREQARAELRAAAQLRPEHGETRRLLAALEQAEADRGSPPPASPAAVGSPAEAAPSVEVTADSLGLFATRVQPILMNTCASCHATGKGGKFRLVQAYEGGLADRRTLERNLAAVLAEVDLNEPEASRLLLKAVSDHAHTGQAPLKSREAAPFRTLREWVRLTAANNPHLREARPSTARPPSGPFTERRAAATSSQWGAEASPAAPAPPATRPGPVPVSSAVPATPPPPAPPAPVDPYDPEPFNRQAHPEANKPDPGR